MTQLDWVIIVGYFAFIGFAAYLFRRFATSSSSFIQGGGSMVWWMAGATAFMTQFSAWTFTGAAAKAYEDGISILFVFWGNALGFFVAAAYFAKRYRRLRVETAMEVIRLRFGNTSEQAFTWLSFPITLIACSIWLNGLASFLAATFMINVQLTIVVISIVVTFIALSGGTWAVSATNVVQLILLVAITVIVGIYALKELHINGGIPEQASWANWVGQDITYWQIFVAWACAMLLQQSFSTNNSISSYRFLATVNESQATKSALLAAVLFVIAPVLWFAPSWVVAALNINLHDAFPSLGHSANNGAYLYFITEYMPKGLLGLVLVAMLAATVAPMTAALNRNAGIVVRNVYQTIINPQASEIDQLRMSKSATIASGMIAAITAILFSLVERYSLFELMMLFSAFIQMPLTIPSLLALIFLRTPDWSGWATILFGLIVSAGMFFLFDVNQLATLLGWAALTPREQVDLHIVSTLAAHIVFTGGFFCLTARFYQPSQRSQLLLTRLNTPLAEKEQAQVDARHGQYLGKLCIVLGLCIGMIGLFPTISDRWVYLAIATLIILSGFGLNGSIHRPKTSHA